jgi:hypothetical protein
LRSGLKPPGRLFHAALAYRKGSGEGKRVTALEATRIVRSARRDGVGAAERRFLQAKIDHFGDRMATRALQSLSSLAPQNSPAVIRRSLRQAARSGRFVSVEEAETIVSVIKRDGASQAERRELLRMSARLGTRIAAGAWQVLDRFRTYADGAVANPYNQRLPVAPGDDGNRITNRAARQATIDFPVRPGATLVDGLGQLRGQVIGKAVHVNYGQRKTISGEPHVYTIATRIREISGKEYSLSGWVPEKALRDGPIRYMPTIAPPVPPRGDGESFRIRADLPDFGNRKVRPNVPRQLRMAADDYLRRPGRKDVAPLVNFLFNLPGKGGVAADCFPPGTTFVRSRGVPARAVPLYKPESSSRSGSMTFVYGRVGDRFGWIARAALTR